jgi:hypothetical protein
MAADSDACSVSPVIGQACATGEVYVPGIVYHRIGRMRKLGRIGKMIEAIVQTGKQSEGVSFKLCHRPSENRGWEVLRLR